MEIYYCL